MYSKELPSRDSLKYYHNRDIIQYNHINNGLISIQNINIEKFRFSHEVRRETPESSVLIIILTKSLDKPKLKQRANLNEQPLDHLNHTIIPDYLSYHPPQPQNILVYTRREITSICA